MMANAYFYFHSGNKLIEWNDVCSVLVLSFSKHLIPWSEQNNSRYEDTYSSRNLIPCQSYFYCFLRSWLCFCFLLSMQLSMHVNQIKHFVAVNWSPASILQGKQVVSWKFNKDSTFLSSVNVQFLCINELCTLSWRHL